jgi:tRNA(fMet)-specific endonuclease VapC
MNGEFLLDTNIVVALLEDDQGVLKHLRLRPRISISVTVLGELYFGAFKSSKLNENLRPINDLLSEVPLIESDAETAHEYGMIKNELQLKGASDSNQRRLDSRDGTATWA